MSLMDAQRPFVEKLAGVENSYKWKKVKRDLTNQLSGIQ